MDVRKEDVVFKIGVLNLLVQTIEDRGGRVVLSGTWIGRGVSGILKGEIVGDPTEVIGLVHRAQSPAEALRVATDILKSIRTLMSQVEKDADCDGALSKVREAIEAYELGKPLA